MKAQTQCLRCERAMVPYRTADMPSGTVRHAGRGLCHTCRQWIDRNDPEYIDDFPRTTRDSLQVLAQYERTRAERPYLTRDDIAQQIGMPLRSLERALTRGRARRRNAESERTN